MSLFDIFKKKPTEKKLDTTSEPEPQAPKTWRNTSDANEFFEGYQAAIKALESEGKSASAETLRADKTQLQLNFIDRFEVETQRQITKITDIDEQTDAIIKAIATVRAYNADMPIQVRTRLAQAKRNLIGETK